MKYLFFLTALINSVLCFAQSSQRDTSKNDIIVIGKPFNGKDGAWLMSTTDSNDIYKVGSWNWNKKMLKQDIKIWGRLVVEKFVFEPVKFDDPNIPSQPPPQLPESRTIKTIIKAKWKIIRRKNIRS